MIILERKKNANSFILWTKCSSRKQTRKFHWILFDIYTWIIVLRTIFLIAWKRKQNGSDGWMSAMNKCNQLPCSQFTGNIIVNLVVTQPIDMHFITISFWIRIANTKTTTTSQQQVLCEHKMTNFFLLLANAKQNETIFDDRICQKSKNFTRVNRAVIMPHAEVNSTQFTYWTSKSAPRNNHLFACMAMDKFLLLIKRTCGDEDRRCKCAWIFGHSPHKSPFVGDVYRIQIVQMPCARNDQTKRNNKNISRYFNAVSDKMRMCV